MRWDVKRFLFGETYTVGKLYCNDNFLCYTLEPRCIDWNIEVKVPGKTAIPAGTYKVRMRWSPKFKRQMPYIENVPHFEGVCLHQGNVASKDSAGCLLVGLETQNGMVLKSREAFRKILEKMDYARKTRQEVTIVIR